MSVLDRPELVPVPLGFCPCLGSPHADGDIVYLWPELSMPGGMAAQGAIAEAYVGTSLDQLLLQELLARVWIRHGVAEWTFLDDLGADIPVTPDTVERALPFAKGGRLVADKADDLYAEAVTAPLVERLRGLSKRGSTRASQPVTSQNGTSHRKSPRRSSTATTDKVPPPE